MNKLIYIFIVMICIFKIVNSVPVFFGHNENTVNDIRRFYKRQLGKPGTPNPAVSIEQPPKIPDGITAAAKINHPEAVPSVKDINGVQNIVAAESAPNIGQSLYGTFSRATSTSLYNRVAGMGAQGTAAIRYIGSGLYWGGSTALSAVDKTFATAVNGVVGANKYIWRVGAQTQTGKAVGYHYQNAVDGMRSRYKETVGALTDDTIEVLQSKGKAALDSKETEAVFDKAREKIVDESGKLLKDARTNPAIRDNLQKGTEELVDNGIQIAQSKAMGFVHSKDAANLADGVGKMGSKAVKSTVVDVVEDPTIIPVIKNQIEQASRDAGKGIKKGVLGNWKRKILAIGIGGAGTIGVYKIHKHLINNNTNTSSANSTVASSNVQASGITSLGKQNVKPPNSIPNTIEPAPALTSAADQSSSLDGASLQPNPLSFPNSFDSSSSTP